jgi:acyl carrier protein
VTEQELRDVVLRVLRRIAPEADAGRIDPRQNLREQLDVDSMDLLNFVIGLHEALQVDIPEADYSRLSTLEGIVEYLAAKKAGAAR